MEHTIYTDEGAKNGKNGKRTKLFRNTDSGTVEWLYADDFSGPCRWYAYGMAKNSIEEMQKGMQKKGEYLLPYEPPANTSELKPKF
jgi:hypothetical protein